MRPSGPCKDCIERHVSCHSECNKYKDWQVEDQRLKEKIIQEKMRIGIGERYKREAIIKALKKKKK